MNIQDWQGSYLAAVSDSRLQELGGEIHAAEQAIFERLQSLAHVSGHETERQAIARLLTEYDGVPVHQQVARVSAMRQPSSASFKEEDAGRACCVSIAICPTLPVQ